MKRAVVDRGYAVWDFVRPAAIIAVVLGILALLGAAGLTTTWILVVVLVWVLPVFVGYRLHVAKDRDAPLVLAVLLGWVGVLVALTLAPAGRTCPRCAEILRRDASICRYCGAELATVSDH